ncbi:MAG: ethanolamine utilization protein EutH [Clostridia bacterium]|nr:ethanolamine utilization protein EutH [Clostridia bacterium]
MENVIIYIMIGFAALGAVDRILGSKFGLGEEFERGILTTGQLVLTMAGIMVLAPVIADLLVPVVSPVYKLLGADPAIFAGSLLAIDMGGAPLAAELADGGDAAILGGIITASMLGVTISFTIPTAMAMTKKEDSPFVAKGILCGIVTIPVGVFVGGISAGIAVVYVLRNMIPIVIVSLIVALGIWKAERITLIIFNAFGKIISAVAILGLLVASLDALLGLRPIRNIDSIADSFAVIGSIALMLAGAFPLVFVLSRVLKKPLVKLGKRTGMNEAAAIGLISSTVNSLLVFKTVENMDERGKVVNMAFAVSASFVLGDHLAYAAGFAPSAILPMMIGKFVAGLSAISVAMLLTKNHKKA